ncbi:MAG: beta-galactosidase [Eubacteriales bacterium]|jgi:beta-galactosidase
MSCLKVFRDHLELDGKRFELICGDFHYFRTLPGGWRRRLELAVDFGLTAIQTYMPWNQHEPEPGHFDFTGRLDLDAFLNLCQEYGLKVMLRPGPYICSEMDFGGLPWWLLSDPRAAVRCMDDRYIAAVDRYLDAVGRVFLPHLSTRGGCIIAVCVENEYGSYGNDAAYLAHLRDKYRSMGVDVPLYTTDGYGAAYSKYGSIPGIWAGVNYRIETEIAFAASREARPDQIPFAGEYWNGRAAHYDETFFHRAPEEIARGFVRAYELGGCLNSYMFCGGTNFGFTSGANYGKTFSPRPGDDRQIYRPLVTSYDVDAMVSEDGIPSEKYFLTRDLLDTFFGRAPRPHVRPAHPTQELSVRLTEACDLLDNLDTVSAGVFESPVPRPMEYFGQGYGFILYTATLHGRCVGQETVNIRGLADRALIYRNGEYIGKYFRDRESAPITSEFGEGDRLSILVENFGRISFGELYDRKGINEAVLLGCRRIFGWEIRTLPMDFRKPLRYTPVSGIRQNRPTFYRGMFDAQAGVDTCFEVNGWGKGFVRVNGFNIGRYWCTGPQMSLYVPGELLKEKDNTLEVFELHGAPECLTAQFGGILRLTAPIAPEHAI